MLDGCIYVERIRTGVRMKVITGTRLDMYNSVIQSEQMCYEGQLVHLLLRTDSRVANAHAGVRTKVITETRLELYNSIIQPEQVCYEGQLVHLLLRTDSRVANAHAGAVSYTHLDVYKRQPSDRSNVTSCEVHFSYKR